MALEPGSLLGSYQIVSLLGAGGMGEVYHARDTRLQRDVAIKVLSASLAQAPEALARFEREALSVAKLSHPNILSIFEFGRHDRTTFVVTELIDGETLRARLAYGPLPQRRATGYALQIARGLAAAHARGIVHRDLKPENVMITRDDQIKILDFGLAKPTETSVTAGDMTQAGALATGAGTILGTFAYMAPEQVRGQPIDHRADMFAFGAVLYEMLSGDRPFKGDTAADTMTAILTKEPPDLEAAHLAISPGLDRIVRRCLEKTPELRFQSANDLAFALENLSTSSSSSTGVGAPVDVAKPAKTASPVWIPWAVAAAAVTAAIAVWFFKPGTAEPERPWQRFTAVTEAAGEETSPALSPDGTTVAYAMRVGNSWDIYAQRVGGRNATPIVNDPIRNEGGPAYSPDGSTIAFHESDDDGGIFLAGATGESVRRLTDAGFDAAWSPDGSRIVFGTEEVLDPSSRQTKSSLYVVEVGGGAPQKLVDIDAIQASWSPSGERIVFWSNTGGQRDLFTVPAAGGARLPLVEDAAMDWAPVWSPDGKFVYFSSDRGGSMNVWRIPIDQATGEAGGAPQPVTTGVQASSTLARFSKDGSRLVFRSRVGSVNPVAIPFDPITNRAGVPVVLDASNNIRVPTDASGDGTMLAYSSIGERQEDLFISRADGKGMRRVTDDSSRDRAPVFTRDNRSLVFYSNRGGDWAIWTVRSDGSSLRRIASAPSGAVYPLRSPIDDTIIFSSVAGREGLFTVPLSGGSPAKLPNTTSTAGYFFATAWSPDGAKLAGPIIAPSGRASGVAIYDLRAQQPIVISADSSFGSQWLPDSRRVVYFTGDRYADLVVVDTQTRQRIVVPVSLPAPSTNEVFAISPDGRTIVYGAGRVESDIWIVERK